MQEFDIYLPSKNADGSGVDAKEIAQIKETLVKAFGGYTHFPQKSEGAWRVGGVTLRDEITIIRVLDDASAKFDMVEFKRTLEKRLRQEAVLIVRRDVEAV